MTGPMPAVQHLSPAYFGMVMATGIVAIAAQMRGIESLAYILFLLGNVMYAGLCLLTVLRIFRFRKQFLSDLLDHQRGPGFFTFVAGSCLLGSQYVLIETNLAVARLFWLIGTVIWVLLTYTIFTAFAVKENKPAFAEGINGGWLLAVVATQSIAVLSALLAPSAVQPIRLELNFLALSMWLWGGMLYIWMIALIFYRYTFYSFSPADLAPPYWINMGAMAISTLAGSLLIINTPGAPYLHSLEPFLKGFTVFFWATGTWWIPMLLVLGVWRHIYKRYPLRYDPLYWGLVFPIGMYTVCTQRMIEAMDLGFLGFIPAFFIYPALFAWAVTFLGFLDNLAGFRVAEKQG